MTIIPPAPVPVDLTALLPLDGSRPMTGPLDFGSDVSLERLYEGALGFSGSAPSGPFSELVLGLGEGDAIWSGPNIDMYAYRHTAGGQTNASISISGPDAAYTFWDPTALDLRDGTGGSEATLAIVPGYPTYASEVPALTLIGGGGFDYVEVTPTHIGWQGDGAGTPDVTLQRRADIDDPGLQLTGELYIGLGPGYTVAGLELSKDYGIYGQGDGGTDSYQVNLNGLFVNRNGGNAASVHAQSFGSYVNLADQHGSIAIGPERSDFILAAAEAGTDLGLNFFLDSDGTDSPRFRLLHDGTMSWGPGGVTAPVPQDLTLKRDYAGGLRLTSPLAVGETDFNIGVDGVAGQIAMGVYDGGVYLSLTGPNTGSYGLSLGGASVRQAATFFGVIDTEDTTRDFELTFGGLRLTSPDGNHTKTVMIDNTGALVAV